MLAVGAGRGCSDIFSRAYHFSPPPPTLWDGWINDVVLRLFSIELQLHQDDGSVTDGCEQWNPIYDRKDPRLKRCSNPELLDQQASTYTTEQPEFLSLCDGSIWMEIMSERGVKPQDNLPTKCSNVHYRIASRKRATSVQASFE